MIQNTLFCKRARAAAGGRKQALVWEGYAARLLCHYITLRGDVQARQRQRKTLWGHERARKGAGRRRLRRSRPAPTGQRSPPGAAGRSASKRGERAGARRGARPRAGDLLRGSSGAARGDSRAGQRARGAHNNAQARRHFYAATPEPVRRPPMMCPRRRAARGRRPEHGHETPGRYPRQNGGRCLNGWLCSGASSGYLLLDIRHRIPSIE